jgi:hypothetical protein
MKNIVFLCVFIFILYGCANQIPEENRIVQSFPFSSPLYLERGNKDESGTKYIQGNINFSKDIIEIVIFAEPNNNVEICSIKTVTYDKDPNEIKYKTDCGSFHVSLKNNIIQTVHWVNTSFSALFNREGEIADNPNIPIPLEKPKNGWLRINIENIGSIDLPPNMEVQGKDFVKNNKEFRKIAEDIWEINLSEPQLTFQPKGVKSNDLTALSKYSRIIYETTEGNIGDYQKLTESIVYNKNEILDLSSELKIQMIAQFRKTPMKIIEWYPTKVIVINGMPSIKISYKRQHGTEPYVIVDMYKFFDYDKIHSLTLSYREKEKTTWKANLKIALDSFRINKYN